MEEFSLAQIDRYVEGLFETYRPRLYSYVLSLMEEKDGGLAEDILQDAFLHVLIIVRSRRRTFDNEQAYLYAVTRNRYIRLSTEAKELYFSELHDTMVDDTHQPEHRIEQREQVGVVTEQIHAFPSKAIQKTMTLLANGHTREEIAQQLDLQKGTIRGYITRGRARLHSTNKEDDVLS
jgi:RNA polymerase sigma factor (sigma-70 family)